MDEASPADAVIFESYGRADAQQVATQIEASLKQKGYKVWLDVQQIPQTEATDKSFWFSLQIGLQKSKVVLALLSPRSVRLAGDIDDWMSVCHNELIFAVDHGIPVVSVRVVNCHPPGVINHYETIEFLDWQNSADLYDKGIEEITQWIDEALSGRHRHRPFVAKLSSSRLTFPWVQPAGTGFVGRDWLLEDLKAFLQSDSRCLLIRGDAGSGKTALSAELVRRHFDQYNSGLMLAYHYCGRDVRTRDAQRFVLSIAGMLSMTVPGYEPRLRNNEAFVDALGADPETMLTQGVLAALNEERLDQTRYIIVDALDEAALSNVDRSASQISIPRLLANSINEFPPWLKLVVTSRPIDEVSAAFHMVQQCSLGGSAAKQLQDVEAYVKRRADEPPLSERIDDKKKLVKAVTQRSAGNFQYVKTVLDELSDGKLAPDNIATLPGSLADLYGTLADARFREADFEPARLVLGVLSAAREPLDREQLALVTGLDRRTELRTTLDRISLFVTWDEAATGERLYRVSHQSIADWLINPPGGSDTFTVDLPKARRLILARCRDWKTHADSFALTSYALTHLIGHLLDESASDREALTEALSVVRAGFFDRRRQHGVNQWHDFDDTRALTLALIGREDQAAILELARTSNIPQRDGVAAALQSAENADAFVDDVVGKLLAVR